MYQCNYVVGSKVDSKNKVDVKEFKLWVVGDVVYEREQVFIGYIGQDVLYFCVQVNVKVFFFLVGIVLMFI